MPTTGPSPKEKLIASAKEHFGVDLTPELDWTWFVAHEDFRDSKEHFTGAALWYQAAAGESAAKDAAANQFFSAAVLHALTHGNIAEEWWLERIEKIGRSWLQHGSADMQQKDADAMAPLIARQFAATQGSDAHDTLETFVLYSPRLWEHAKAYLLPQRVDENGAWLGTPNGDLQARYFRNAPELFQTNSAQQELFYDYLCGAFNFNVLKPANIAQIFTGVHHTTDAWKRPLHMALGRHEEAMLAPHWATLAPVFAALEFNPEQESAWWVWTALNTAEKHAAYLGPVRGALQEAHPKMQQVYQDIWPMASALEEGQAAFTIAAEMHKKQTMGMEPEAGIALPSGFVRP